MIVLVHMCPQTSVQILFLFFFVWLFSSNSQREISALTSQQSSELASGKAQLKFVCICKQLDRLTLCVLIALLVYCFFLTVAKDRYQITALIATGLQNGRPMDWVGGGAPQGPQ